MVRRLRVSLRRWARLKHIFHYWGAVHIFTEDAFTWSGLFWGWKHSYQLCIHPGCKMTRLVEGFRPQEGYYLRPGFDPKIFEE